MLTVRLRLRSLNRLKRSTACSFSGIICLLRPGFKKVKGVGSSRSKLIPGTTQGAAAARRDGNLDSWEEFAHPLFRRGRRDLLVGIKRQKDSGRLKRTRGVTLEGVRNIDNCGVNISVIKQRRYQIPSIL